uniref:Uncharacterized protein n=1 Tax=Rhizophora mucronata TaxID=61149 RepID=A0A2P2NKQ3_RHIMU
MILQCDSNFGVKCYTFRHELILFGSVTGLCAYCFESVSDTFVCSMLVLVEEMRSMQEPLGFVSVCSMYVMCIYFAFSISRDLLNR